MIIQRGFAACPVCFSEDLEYEFIVEKSPVSRCLSCSLLFINPQHANVARPESPQGEDAAAMSRLSALLRAHSAASPQRVLVAGPETDLEVRLAGYPNGTFDGCVLDSALERSADPVSVLREVRRVLAPGASVVVAAISVMSRGALRERGRWPGFRAYNRFYFDVDNLQSLLIRSGFTDPVTFPVTDVPGRADHVLIAVRAAGETRPERLSIIVPVYNEKATFTELIEQVLAKEVSGMEREVIIVESNSTDGSREEVLRYREHPLVRVILEERPRGKGFAMRTGLAHATGDIVLFQDADLEYDVEDYDALVRPIRAFQRNFVIGSRHNPRGESWKIRSFNNQPLMSHLFNAGHVFFQTLLNVLYAQSLNDAFSMYKVFRRDCLYGLEFECNRFDFDHEIVIKLVRKGYRPLEIPVNYRSRSLAEGKKVTLVRDPLTWLRVLTKQKFTPLYPHLTF